MPPARARRSRSICATAGSRLRSSDGGPGFDPAAVRADGLGLAGLKERVESIGGQFDAAELARRHARLITFNVEELEHA